MLRGRLLRPGCIPLLMPRRRGHDGMQYTGRWDGNRGNLEWFVEESRLGLPTKDAMGAVVWTSSRGCPVCRCPAVRISLPHPPGMLRHTRNCCTNPLILLSICAFSLSETALGGVKRFSASSPLLSAPNRALLITQHQNGTVLLRASGMLLPRLVESTITQPPR